MYIIKKLFNPEIFQGKYKKRNYFEGWYFKIIAKSLHNNLAIIPGICFDQKKKDSHAFVQVIDGHTCKVNYLKYDISSFIFNENRFELRIGDSYFSDKKIILHLEDKDLSINGELTFQNIISYPKKIFHPGIMGPFSFVPFMECYHGIVNIHHDILGHLSIQENEVDFNHGYGYIEKDWGKSFPEAWIWMQSNHFGNDDVTLMFSIAKIPWLSKYFIGFLSFLRIKNKIYQFSTYTNAKILELNYHQNKLKIIISDKSFTMEINAEHSKGGILKAPKNGLMNREILESITATVAVRLSDNNNNRLIYEGVGTNTGMEIVEEIFKYFKKT